MWFMQLSTKLHNDLTDACCFKVAPSDQAPPKVAKKYVFWHFFEQNLALGKGQNLTLEKGQNLALGVQNLALQSGQNLALGGQNLALRR